MSANLPTKAELQKTSLVDIDRLHTKATANTLQVAEHFGKRHDNVLKRIAVLSKRGHLQLEASYYLNQQGKRQKYHELNRDQFLLVVFGFTGEKADGFKSDFIRLFNQQEAELTHWREKRLTSISTTKQANNQVHLLQEALRDIIPHSKRCTMLFIHIQQAITKAATGSAKTERATMTAEQLQKISKLEGNINADIERLMSAGVEPETVRNNVLSAIKATGKEKATHDTDQDKESGSFNTKPLDNPQHDKCYG